MIRILRVAFVRLPAASTAVTVILALTRFPCASARRAAVTAAFGSRSRSVAVPPEGTDAEAGFSRKIFAAPGTVTFPAALAVQASTGQLVFTESVPRRWAEAAASVS